MTCVVTYYYRIPITWARAIFYSQYLICKFLFFADKEGKFISITNRWAYRKPSSGFTVSVDIVFRIYLLYKINESCICCYNSNSIVPWYGHLICANMCVYIWRPLNECYIVLTYVYIDCKVNWFAYENFHFCLLIRQSLYACHNLASLTYVHYQCTHCYKRLYNSGESHLIHTT